jgi:hypothetical protein
MHRDFQCINDYDIELAYAASLSSKILFGRNCSNKPNVIQKGRIKPIKKINNQNAIPAIKRNNTIPKVLIFYYFCGRFRRKIKNLKQIKNKKWNLELKKIRWER